LAEVTGFLDVYSNPQHIVEYADGECRQQFRSSTSADQSAVSRKSTTKPNPVLQETKQTSLA